MCYGNIRLYNGIDKEFYQRLENRPEVVGLAKHNIDDKKSGKKKGEVLVTKIETINQITVEFNKKFDLDETKKKIESMKEVMEVKIIDKIDGRLLGETTREEIELGIS